MARMRSNLDTGAAFGRYGNTVSIDLGCVRRCVVANAYPFADPRPLAGLAPFDVIAHTPSIPALVASSPPASFRPASASSERSRLSSPTHSAVVPRAPGFTVQVVAVRLAQMAVACRVVLTGPLDRLVALNDGHAAATRLIARRDRRFWRTGRSRRAKTKHFHHQNSLCLRFQRWGSAIHGYGSFTATI